MRTYSNTVRAPTVAGIQIVATRGEHSQCVVRSEVKRSITDQQLGGEVLTRHLELCLIQFSKAKDDGAVTGCLSAVDEIGQKPITR